MVCIYSGSLFSESFCQEGNYFIICPLSLTYLFYKFALFLNHLLVILNLAEFWERENETGHSGPLSSLQSPRETRQIHRIVKTEERGELGRWECLVSRASLQIARSHLKLLAEHFPKLSSPLFSPPQHTHFWGDPGRHFNFFMSIQQSPSFRAHCH